MVFPLFSQVQLTEDPPNSALKKGALVQLLNIIL